MRKNYRQHNRKSSNKKDGFGTRYYNYETYEYRNNFDNYQYNDPVPSHGNVYYDTQISNNPKFDNQSYNDIMPSHRNEYYKTQISKNPRFDNYQSYNNTMPSHGNEDYKTQISKNPRFHNQSYNDTMPSHGNEYYETQMSKNPRFHNQSYKDTMPSHRNEYYKTQISKNPRFHNQSYKDTMPSYGNDYYKTSISKNLRFHNYQSYNDAIPSHGNDDYKTQISKNLRLDNYQSFNDTMPSHGNEYYETQMSKYPKFDNYQSYNDTMPSPRNEYDETQISKNPEFDNQSYNDTMPFHGKEYDETQISDNPNIDNYQSYNDTMPSHENEYDETQINNNPEVKITPSSSNETRIVEKSNLYKCPELNTNRYMRFQYNKIKFSKNDMNYWQKEIETNTHMDVAENTKSSQKSRFIKNRLEKKLKKMLAKPAEMNKGKSMLEKMGWKGGGLGKDGEGIVEPITPEAKYATKMVGLGHGYAPKREDNDIDFSNNFRTNILLKILEFVKNDSEVDLLFHNSLWRSERKRVHTIVQELRECGDVEDLGYNKPMDVEIARDILEHNSYLLFTESEGKGPARQLRLNKIAPEHVYLVMPDDLKDYDENDELDDEVPEDKKGNEIESFMEKVKELEVENDNAKVKEQSNSEQDSKNISSKCASDNPMENEEGLESKIDNTKDNLEQESENTSNSVLSTIIDCFKEFIEDTDYTDFRFLGPFDSTEVSAIKTFFDICLKKDVEESKEKSELLEALNDEQFEFEIKEDCNGSLVIYKIDRTHQLPLQ